VSAVCLSVGFFIIAIDLLGTATKVVAEEEMYSVKHTHTLYTYAPFIFSRDRQICSSANFALLNQQYTINLYNSIRPIIGKCMKRYISTHTCRRFSSAESLVLSPSRSSISAGPVNILTSQLQLLHGKQIFFLERSRTNPFSLSCYFQLYCILDKDFAVKSWGSERC